MTDVRQFEVIFLFDTTHHALWAEELAGEKGVPVEVIVPPSDANAKCGIALRTRGQDGPVLEAHLQEEEVEYSLYQRDGGSR